MLRRHRQLRTQFHLLVDAGVFALGFWLAHWIRSHWQIEVFGGTARIQPFEDYFWLFVTAFVLPLLLLPAQGFYDRRVALDRVERGWRLFKVCTYAVVAVILLMFILRVQLARSVIILFGPVSFLLVLVKDELLRRWGKTKLGQAQNQRRVILIGSHSETARLAADLGGESSERVEVLARMDLSTAPAERLAALLHEHSANTVIISARHTYFEQVEQAIQICELEGVEAWLLADFFRTQISQTSADDLLGRPTLVFRAAPEVSWQSVIKQTVDVLGALVLLVACTVPLLVVSALIRLTSRGPVLFRQERCGLNGHPFTMLKFRTMVSNAEQRQAELAAFNEMSGPVFKVSKDPRVTPLGRWLRKYSIDELPQLWNVLRGEMSLVGPRPLPVGEVRRFDDPAHRRRLSVKPGLTCLWQVRGRNNVTNFADWVRLDLEYIDNWSLWLDFKILLRTIPVVLMGTGAK
ncbi:MAG: sugar transferase [Verrucomicrobia bacterium]|nr:sugar transferase [Verrucomicrobiota bacterium]